VNNALTFLGIAVAIAVIGGLAVAILHRNPESASADGVDQFQRIMNALAPDDDPAPSDDASRGDES
jgi:hypothetical protein